MVKVSLDPGICGFPIIIHASSEDMQNVKITLNTGCPNLKGINEELQNIDAFKVCFSKIGEGDIYEITKKYIPHAACPVPSAIIKAIEIAAGLALPKDVLMKIE